MKLDGYRNAERLALEVLNSLPDQTDMSMHFEPHMTVDQYPEEEIYHAMSIVNQVLWSPNLPSHLVKRSWVCAICNDADVVYGQKCEDCIEELTASQGIGISEIANMEVEDV